MGKYSEGVVNKESFRTAFPELYDEIVRDAQMKSPSLEIEGIKMSREAIASDMEGRLSGNRSISEERAKATWNKDPAIREEFRGNFNAYFAWLKQSEAGNARILRKKISA
jgi:hypothetical protein